MKPAFLDRSNVKPPALGVLLLLLLIVESTIAVAIITKKLSSQMVSVLLVTSVLFALIVIIGGTLIIWNRPTPPGPRLEVLIDIPETSVEQIREDFSSEGAYVAVKQQKDGLYRVEALFLNGARVSRLVWPFSRRENNTSCPFS